MNNVSDLSWQLRQHLQKWLGLLQQKSPIETNDPKTDLVNYLDLISLKMFQKVASWFNFQM